MEPRLTFDTASTDHDVVLDSPFGSVTPRIEPVPGTPRETFDGRVWTLRYLVTDPYPPVDLWEARGDRAVRAGPDAVAEAWMDPTVDPPRVSDAPFEGATLAWSPGGGRTDPEEAARAYVAWREGALAGVAVERWIDGNLVEFDVRWTLGAAADVPVIEGAPVAVLSREPPEAPTP